MTRYVGTKVGMEGVAVNKEEEREEEYEEWMEDGEEIEAAAADCLTRAITLVAKELVNLVNKVLLALALLWLFALDADFLEEC